jgi:hypothetical protein
MPAFVGAVSAFSRRAAGAIVLVTGIGVGLVIVKVAIVVIFVCHDGEAIS